MQNNKVYFKKQATDDKVNVISFKYSSNNHTYVCFVVKARFLLNDFYSKKWQIDLIVQKN